MTEHEDRLIRVLLCEVLGGERPPDVAERVLARAFARRGGGRRWTVRVAAAAALVIVVSAGWILLQGGYPGPRISGDYQVVGGGPVRRGTVVATRGGRAELFLGGYCRAEMAPGTRVRIVGRPRAESLALQQGTLTCDVDRARGAFTVTTDVGTAEVIGTKFEVTLTDEKGGEKMMGRQMFVRVLVGTVL